MCAFVGGGGVVGWGEGVADAAAGAEGFVALASRRLGRVGRFGERRVAGDEDGDRDVHAGRAELGDGAGELVGDPRGPGGVLDDPDELHAADGQAPGRGAVGDVEELGEDERDAGGAGDQDDGVEGGEVGVGAAVWAVDEGRVRLRGRYGVLLRFR